MLCTLLLCSIQCIDHVVCVVITTTVYCCCRCTVLCNIHVKQLCGVTFYTTTTSPIVPKKQKTIRKTKGRKRRYKHPVAKHTCTTTKSLCTHHHHHQQPPIPCMLWHHPEHPPRHMLSSARSASQQPLLPPFSLNPDPINPPFLTHPTAIVWDPPPLPSPSLKT